VHPPPLPAWANFTLMKECTPESSLCYSVYSVIVTLLAEDSGTMCFCVQDQLVCGSDGHDGITIVAHLAADGRTMCFCVEKQPVCGSGGHDRSTIVDHLVENL
jgi:hypothetical protein